MKWQTWTKISSVILFLLAVLGFYYANYYNEGPAITIQNFPTSTDLDSLDVNQDITFSFFIYNSGDETAFIQLVDYVWTTDGIPVTREPGIDPREDFTIEPGESKEIFVNLPAPGAASNSEFQIRVYFTGQTYDTRVQSDIVPVAWGTLLS